ncbi:probable serine/threonine-protein kinase MARK-A [Nilaparvata lugens]|uniref:probable serine/threonine-protein kinase MARK-A n=1 Tax=Nilaparvata lugens TaxID=108931 RepID=UPI00193CA5E4|nr:probable serine/threonine-protein kinase MARK-A [Nilaparvata lugens]
MNTNLLRLKISELTKKYSNKKVSVDEDLSLSDDYSGGEDDTVKYRLKPDNFVTKKAVEDSKLSQPVNKSLSFHQIEPLKSPQVVTPKSGSSRSEKGKKRHKLSDTPRSTSITSVRSSKHLDSLDSPQDITQRSKSLSDKVDNFSDLLSDEELENPQEIDEDSDDSSDYHPLKNIHLVSDDFLEDIHTASEASPNSENVEERLTNRSTPRSVKSIPLSPFISPPALISKRSEIQTKTFTSENDSVIEEQLESDGNISKNYESSFENEDESSGSGTKTLKKSSKSGSETLKTRKSSRRSSLSNNSRNIQDFDTSTSASIVKTPSESSVQESVTNRSNKSSGRSSKSEDVEEILESDTNSASESDRKDSSRAGEQEEGGGPEKVEEDEGRIHDNDDEEEERKETEDKRVTKLLSKSNTLNSGATSEIQDLKTKEYQESRIILPNDLEKTKKDTKVEESKQSGETPLKKSTQSILSTGQEIKTSKTKKSNTKYVQCDLITDRRPIHKYRRRTPFYYDFEPSYRDHRRIIPVYYDFESPYREENIIQTPFLPRRKPLKIDTRVKNLPNRPVLTTNIGLFGGSTCLDNDLDFHVDCDNNIGDNELNPVIAMDKILRNQINLTKYFMESHHNMYMACCKIVKSLNEDYKNDGLIS